MVSSSLISDFEIRGKWWIPNQQSNSINGVLSFSTTGSSKLELDGTLIGLPTSSDQSEKFDVIHGLSIKDERCTLIDSFQTKYEHNVPGADISTVVFNSLFVGNEFVNPPNELFESAII